MRRQLTRHWDFPANCTPGSQLNVRFQAPSCWDGIHLDSPDHKATWPTRSSGVCPAVAPGRRPDDRVQDGVAGQRQHGATCGCPAAVATRSTTTSSTPGTPPTLAALATHCINGGLQCDPRGFDQYKPERGAALNENYVLP